jgi:curved DNA-binding protein CbpA
MENPYKTLDIEPGATEKEIKKAYRDLSKKWHPDVNDGKDEIFKEIKFAYELLMDREKRKHYDEHGEVLEDESDKIFHGAQENLIHAMKSILTSRAFLQSPETFNLIKKIKETIGEAKESAQDKLTEAGEKIYVYEKIIALFEPPKPTDFLKNVLLEEKATAEQTVKMIKRDLEVFKVMEEIIQGYKYNFKEPKRIFGDFHGMHTRRMNRERTVIGVPPEIIRPRGK